MTFADGRSWNQWRWQWVGTSWANHKSMWQCFGVLRVKCQKASLNRRPNAYTSRGGLGSHPTPVTWYETDGQCNTRDGSSGWPSALLEISYFTGELQYVIFHDNILGLGKTTNSQDRFPAYISSVTVTLSRDTLVLNSSLSLSPFFTIPWERVSWTPF